MNITEVSQPKDLPKKFMPAYALSDKYTANDAAISYQRRFGIEPVQAWLWKNTLYIEKVEEK